MRRGGSLLAATYTKPWMLFIISVNTSSRFITCCWRARRKQSLWWLRRETRSPCERQSPHASSSCRHFAFSRVIKGRQSRASIEDELQLLFFPVMCQNNTWDAIGGCHKRRDQWNTASLQGLWFSNTRTVWTRLYASMNLNDVEEYFGEPHV